MNYTRQDQGNSSELIVNQLRTEEDALQLQAALLELLASKERIQVNLGGQAEISIHGLQLLCAAHRSAAKEHKQLTLTNIPEPLLALVRQAGFLRQDSCLPGFAGNCLWVEAPGGK